MMRVRRCVGVVALLLTVLAVSPLLILFVLLLWSAERLTYFHPNAGTVPIFLSSVIVLGIVAVFDFVVRIGGPVDPGAFDIVGPEELDDYLAVRQHDYRHLK